MDKFNRKYSKACERVSFWDALNQHFMAFNVLLKPRESLTGEDRKILYNIHTLLYECSQKASKQRRFHAECLDKMVHERLRQQKNLS